MNFALLKEIVVKLKHKFRCPKCRKHYGNRLIEITAVKPDNLDVVFSCRHCEIQVFTNIALVPANEIDGKEISDVERQHRAIKVKANSFSCVSDNDILDMKNFLREFKGSFKSLFNIKNEG